MTSIEIVHGAPYPENDPQALGLLFGITDDGERIALVVDPAWLEMLIEAINTGHDVRYLDIPENVMLPIGARGWAEDWTHADRREIDDILRMFRAAGCDWTSLRKAVDEITGFQE
jgi:hypothetical protein